MRALREGAGKTTDDVATAGIASRTKTWRIEHGRTTVRLGDVLALTRLYDADNEAVDQLMRLAEATKGTGYTEDFKGAVRESAWLFAELEADAAAITEYCSELIAGLLQTEDYIRAIMQDNGSLTPQAVDRRVAFRLRRQRAFFDRAGPGRMDAIITAGALSVQVGSALAMKAQREHLCTLARRDGVSIRVLPFENGLHPGTYGPFTILDFDDPDDAPLAYVEDLVGSHYIDQEDHVARFRAAIEHMRSQAVSVEDYLR